MDPEIKALIEIMLKSHDRLTASLIAHIQSTSETDKAVASLVDVVKNLVATTESYVKSSQERIIFVEKQLDTLINAIFPNKRVN